MNYSEDLINTYRKKIYEFLKDYEGEPVVIEGIPADLLREILFDKGSVDKRYFFASEIREAIEKIDFRNVNFDNFNIGGIDFNKLKNVSLNPDKIDFYHTSGRGTTFGGVYFTKKITVSTELCNVSFKGSFNAQLNFDDSFFTWFGDDDFCDVTFKKPFNLDMSISRCNFEGSHGATINLNKIFIRDTVLYDATIYGNFNLRCHERITPSIEEIKRVYGDIMQPTLIRRKDFD